MNNTNTPPLLLLNGTSIGIHDGHLYFHIDISDHRTVLIVGLILFFAIFAFFLNLARLTQYVFCCEFAEGCCGEEKTRKTRLEISAHSTDRMIPSQHP
jgi:hypothetical protein